MPSLTGSALPSLVSLRLRIRIFVGFLKKESNALLRHDKLHVFAVHAGAGLVGMCLTGLLAEYVACVLRCACPNSC